MAATFKQRAEWCWQNDDNADIDLCSLAANVQEFLVVRVPDKVHLRIAVENTGNATGSIAPELWVSEFATFFGEVKVSAATDLRTANGLPADDDSVDSDPFFSLNTAFVAGIYTEDNAFGGSVSLPAGKVTVFAFCIRGMTTANGKKYWLRLKKAGGAAMDAYDASVPTIKFSHVAKNFLLFGQTGSEKRDAVVSPTHALSFVQRAQGGGRAKNAIAFTTRAQTAASAKSSITFTHSVKPEPNQLSASSAIAFLQYDPEVGDATGPLKNIEAPRFLSSFVGFGNRANPRVNNQLAAFQGITFQGTAHASRVIALTAATGRGTGSSFLVGGDAGHTLNLIALSAKPRQTSWRFGQDDNANADNVTFAALDTRSAVAIGTKFMLRVQVKNVGDLSGNVAAELWASRTADFASEFQVTSSSDDLQLDDGLPGDGDSTLVNRCAIEPGFIPGTYDEEGHINPLAIGKGKAAEFQWCLRSDTDGNFYFRVKGFGSVVLSGGYASYPALRVQPRVSSAIAFGQSIGTHGATTRAASNPLTFFMASTTKRDLQRAGLTVINFGVEAMAARPPLQRAASTEVAFASEAAGPAAKPRSASSALTFVSIPVPVSDLLRNAATGVAFSTLAVSAAHTPTTVIVGASAAITFNVFENASAQVAHTSKDLVTQVILSHNRLGQQGTYRRRRERQLVS